MSLNWTLLLDADLSQTDWQYSAATDATLLRIEQENVPRIGRFSIAQVLPDRSEFIDIKAYPAAAETTRLSLDYPDPTGRLIAIRPTYSEFPDDAPNTWRVKIYGAKPELQPPINPSAVLLTLDPRIAGAVPVAEKGVPMGVATLNQEGVIPDEQLPHSNWAELLAANLSAVDALANQVESIQMPTLDELGGEPKGSELRARNYTDEKFGSIVFPAMPTLDELGGEPAGAESRSRQYADQLLAQLDSRIKTLEPKAPPVVDIRINCGSTLDYVAADGKTWSRDQYFSFGNADTTYLGIVGGTYDFVLFNYSRSGGGGFNYKIPLQNGSYVVELGFSENFHTAAGSRRFNVDIEGIRVLTNFDIRAAAGARYSAIKRIFPVVVADGELNIIFGAVTDAPQVNNIRVYSA